MFQLVSNYFYLFLSTRFSIFLSVEYFLFLLISLQASHVRFYSFQLVFVCSFLFQCVSTCSPCHNLFPFGYDSFPLDSTCFDTFPLIATLGHCKTSCK